MCVEIHNNSKKIVRKRLSAGETDNIFIISIENV